ncbi:hypothetical protein C8Q70DRAFT_1059493 [Cubamyces menziesii]|nr:hypothetical protein C8Q70DRAFT_1059493 [Cubamyces menziesii]
MILVFERPRSEWSTLLKVLANQWQEYHSVAGEVRYDSLTPEEIEKCYHGDTLHLATTTRTRRMRLDGVSPSDRSASTAQEFIHALRITTDIMKCLTVEVINQAGELLDEESDKVCVLL